MRSIKKNILLVLLTGIAAMGVMSLAVSCNRAITYEDGMFDYDEIYTNDAVNDTFQINSEIDNDDTERY